MDQMVHEPLRNKVGCARVTYSNMIIPIIISLQPLEEGSTIGYKPETFVYIQKCKVVVLTCIQYQYFLWTMFLY